MKSPDLSYVLTVAQWRYIQSLHEPIERRNPDRLVGQLLSLRERWGAKWAGRKRLDALRSHRFYYYLIARTRYYDRVFLDAIARGVKHIVNVGCGTDTRAYRFAEQLRAGGVRVCECDQPEVIVAKQRACRRRWPSSEVSYLALDLNDESWPDFAGWLDAKVSGPALVLMEGLTPYLNADSVSDFLALLADKLPAGSLVAYDFKISGVSDQFGRGARSGALFRLPFVAEDVAAYHEERGYRLGHIERGDELSLRLMPALTSAGIPLFQEDVVIQAAVAKDSVNRTDGEKTSFA
jgi:methyltransferase (TIGR00027 family)